MNPIHGTQRPSVALAGIAAAALALPACQGTASAAGHRPHHHATQAIVHQTQNGITFADLQGLAKVKRDLLQGQAERSPKKLGQKRSFCALVRGESAINRTAHTRSARTRRPPADRVNHAP